MTTRIAGLSIAGVRVTEPFLEAGAGDAMMPDRDLMQSLSVTEGWSSTPGGA